ncbi:hypothetical protein ASG68_13655 [Rhizobium sp. Leaf453]|nr:hypothetical protein ASG42_18845 [Rhizobium sp. Leaf391]KQT06916.1 hypothetical protein ASG50_00295 [Rhizobium sp. Leaf386]KQT95059.1 hypothetical protein ASG68_13655 [Rhizobium sp. Leaf453]
MKEGAVTLGLSRQDFIGMNMVIHFCLLSTIDSFASMGIMQTQRAQQDGNASGKIKSGMKQP